MNSENRSSLSRRQFLSRAGTAASSLALGGAVVADEKKPRLIIGSGSHRYECIHDWLVPPSDILWGDTQGVCLDSKGNIYVTHTVHPDSPKKDAIVVFDKKGKFLRSWGSRFAGGGHGVEIRKEGKTEYAYHSDTAHRMVVKTDLEGNVIWEKGVPVESGVYPKENPVYIPTNVAFSPNGDFYIADGYGSNWIHQYDIKGNYIRTFGGTGKDQGKFVTPHGIWLDNRGSEPLLAITDRANSRLEFFSLDGKFVKSVQNGMRLPCYIDVHGDEMMVPDLKSVVTILDKDDKVVAQLGDGDPSNLRGHPRSEFIPGKFIHPHGGKYLKNGDILVAEWINIGRMTLLKRVRS